MTDDPAAWLDGFAEPRADPDDVDRIAERLGRDRADILESIERLRAAGWLGPSDA